MFKPKLAAAFVAALALPAAAQAQVSSHTARDYQRAYHQVVVRFGHRAPGRNILNDGLSSGERLTTARVRRSIAVLDRMLRPPVVHRAVRHRTVYTAPALAPAAPAAQPEPVTRTRSAPQSAPASTGGLSSVPGVPSSFAGCVAFRESTNGTNVGSGGVYGLTSVPGSAGMSIAQQKQAFSRLYAQDGTAPWAPYDHC